MMSLLNLDYELVNVDLQTEEQKSAWFLQLNPLAQVPVLIDAHTVIWDAQAILVYLAQQYSSEWLPTKPEAMSKVMQ